jgi:hypothetical protein
MTVAELMNRYVSKPIRNCPGRFFLDVAPELSPSDLLGPDIEVEEFCSPQARDKVLVARLADGGLITYRRADGSHLHTINSSDGFARKLAQLGIPD